MERVPLGQLAIDHPQAIDVFERYGLDFCCRGGSTLSEACDKADVPLLDVVAALEAAIPAPREWTGSTPEELIDHILEVYHRPLDTDLPRLEKLAQKVARVHGDREPRLVHVRDTLRMLVADLTSHMAKEEQVLFPMIRAGSTAVHHGPIAMMRLEHEEAGELLGALHLLTDSYRAPPEACGSWQALYSGLEALERDLHKHIHLENNVLFRMLEDRDG